MRPSRRLLAALAVVSIGAGGFFGVQRATSVESQLAPSSGYDASDASLMMAAQPMPTPPSAPSPSSPAKSMRKLAAFSPKPTTSATNAASPSGSSIAAQLLAQINQLRAQHGLAPYTLLAGLNRSAHQHNLAMIGSCGLSHQCPGEPSLGDRISKQGVRWSTCGENIGWSGPHPNTTSALVAAADSMTLSMYNEKPPNDGHRLNLLSTAFHHVGIDVVRDSSGTVWLTQDFSN